MSKYRFDFPSFFMDTALAILRLLVIFLYALVAFILWNGLSFSPKITYVDSVIIICLFEMILAIINKSKTLDK